MSFARLSHIDIRTAETCSPGGGCAQMVKDGSRVVIDSCPIVGFCDILSYLLGFQSLARDVLLRVFDQETVNRLALSSFGRRSEPLAYTTKSLARPSRDAKGCGHRSHLQLVGNREAPGSLPK